MANLEAAPKWNPAAWLAGIVATIAIGAISGLSSTVLHHEGVLGSMETKIDAVQRSLERIEKRLDGNRMPSK